MESDKINWCHDTKDFVALPKAGGLDYRLDFRNDWPKKTALRHSAYDPAGHLFSAGYGQEMKKYPLIRFNMYCKKATLQTS
jgi:hypothetical protein